MPTKILARSIIAFVVSACSSSDDGPMDAGAMGAGQDAGVFAEADAGSDAGASADPTPALVGAWVGFRVVGIKIPASYRLDVTGVDGGPIIEIAAMELRADGSMVFTEDETYARSSDDWRDTETGLWSVTQDGQLEIIARGEVGRFTFELTAERLTIRDARNEVTLYEAVGSAPTVTPSLLSGAGLYQVTDVEDSGVSLPGDCSECADFSYLYFAFASSGTADILRGYLPTTLSSFPMSYPFQGESDRDGPEVVVCGDRPPWSLLNATLTLDVQGASSTWTTRAELFGAINLIGSDTALLLTPFDGLPEDFAAVQTSEMLRLCRQIGVRPQGYSWFALEDWSRPLQRAQTLDEDCPAEDRIFIGFLDGGPGRARLAGRVVVPALPFVVHGVRFEKVYQPNSNCRDTVAARVDVFRSATTIPPENPRIDRSSVAGALLETNDRTVEVTFIEPLIVTEGEQLFVAVELVAEEASSTCIGACRQVSADAVNRSWLETSTGWRVYAAPDDPVAFEFEAIGVAP